MRETPPNTPITPPSANHSHKAAHLCASSGVPDLDEPSGTGTRTGYGHPMVSKSVGSYATTRIRTHLGSCIGVPDLDDGFRYSADNQRPVWREIDAVDRPRVPFEGAYLQDKSPSDNGLRKTCGHPRNMLPTKRARPAYVVAVQHQTLPPHHLLRPGPTQRVLEPPPQNTLINSTPTTHAHKLALSQSIWSRQFGETRLSSAPKLTNLYRTPGLLTCD